MQNHDSILNMLETVVRENRVANAYLFSGGTKAERDAYAMAFARMIATSEADIIRPEQEKPQLFSVEDVRRTIYDTVYIKPYGEGKKVYLLENAALMNVQAENALLKTLEEPPEYVVLILLAANEAYFLPTILSRCIKISLTEKRESAEAPDEGTNEMWAAVEKALSLLNQTKDIRTEQIIDAVSAFGRNRLFQEPVLEAMRSWFRDVLSVKLGATQAKLENRNSERSLKEAAELLSYEDISDILDRINETRRRLESNVSFELSFEALFLAIGRAYKEAL